MRYHSRFCCVHHAGSHSNEHTWFDWRIYHLAINTTMPRQSGNSVRGRTGFSKSWGLPANVSFSPFPSPVTHFFAHAPIFARLKNKKCLERAENLTETLATQASFESSIRDVAWPVSRKYFLSICLLHWPLFYAWLVLQRIPCASLCLGHTVMCRWYFTGTKIPTGKSRISFVYVWHLSLREEKTAA